MLTAVTYPLLFVLLLPLSNVTKHRNEYFTPETSERIVLFENYFNQKLNLIIYFNMS